MSTDLNSTLPTPAVVVDPNSTTTNATETTTPAPPAEVVLDEVDFNDLLELERSLRTSEEQLNKLSGTIFRLTKDQEVYLAHEKNLNVQIENKKRELIKRHKLDEKRQWKVDVNTRKVVYV